MKTYISNLEKISKKSIIVRKIIYFNCLRNFQNRKTMQKYKINLFSNQVKFTLKKLLSLYRQFFIRIKFKYVCKWLENSKLKGKLLKYRAELEHTLEKKIEKETRILDQKVKDKEKEILEMKKQISKNLDLSTELTKKIKEAEEKETKNNALLKKLEVKIKF